MAVAPVTLRPGRPAAWQFRAWELLAPRVPLWARRLVARLVRRLPLGSRARRWWVRGGAAIIWEMTARSRADLYLPAWDPVCEWRWNTRDWGGLGFDEAYHGHDGVVRSVEHWNTIWTDVGFTVREVLDGGDTVLCRVTLSGRGARSGAPVQREFSSIARLDPMIVDYENFLDDAAALREAGFGP